MENEVINYMKEMARDSKTDGALGHVDYHLQTIFGPKYGKAWENSIQNLADRSYLAKKLNDCKQKLENTNFGDLQSVAEGYNFIYNNAYGRIFSVANATNSKSVGNKAKEIFDSINYDFQMKNEFRVKDICKKIKKLGLE